jgi:hypothetical protein
MPQVRDAQHVQRAAGGVDFLFQIHLRHLPSYPQILS